MAPVMAAAPSLFGRNGQRSAFALRPVAIAIRGCGFSLLSPPPRTRPTHSQDPPLIIFGRIALSSNRYSAWPCPDTVIRR